MPAIWLLARGHGLLLRNYSLLINGIGFGTGCDLHLNVILQQCVATCFASIKCKRSYHHHCVTNLSPINNNTEAKTGRK
jgi:hypothetical protein